MANTTTSLDDILGSLESPLEAQRERAVHALVRTSDIRAIPALQRVATSDESVRIRYHAKKALFVLKQRFAKELPDDGTEGVAPAAPVDLERVRTILAGDDASRKLALLRILARLDMAAAKPVLVAAGRTESDGIVRSNILIVLGMLGDDGDIKDVASFLHDEDPRVRANAIEALEYIGHPNAYPIIVNALADPDNRIRANAIKALRNYGKVNVVNLLRKMLHSSQEWMRDSAAYALSMVAKEDALPLLVETLQDSHDTVRRRAAEGLRNLARRGNATAVTLVAELDRRPAADGVPAPCDLRALLDSHSAPRDNRLASPDPQIRMQELRIIVDERDTSRLFDVVELAQTEQDAFIRANAVIALGRLGDESLVDTVAGFLSSPVDRVRANAVEALSILGGERVPSLLIPFLDDANNRCKANAIIALKDHPYVNILKPLQQMVTSDELLMRKSAFYAVTDIATDEVIALLEPLANDADEDVRRNARHFLEMTGEGGNATARRILERLPDRSREGADSLTGDFFSDGTLDTAASEIAATKPGSGLLDGARNLDSAIDLDFGCLGEESALDGPSEISLDDLSGDPDGPPPASPVEDHASRPFMESVEEKPFRYTIDAFIGLPRAKKRAIIEELRNEVTVQAYLFLREVLNDKDFEVKCLAKVALKVFEGEDFASGETGKEQDRGWLFERPELQTVEYQGLKKTIMLSRDLNDKAQQYEYSKTWPGPFGEEFPLLNALREDTQDMLQFVLRDEKLRRATACFHHDRLKPFLEGKRSLDGNRFANVVTLTNVVHRIDPYSPSAKMLREIKRPIYLLALFGDERLVLFLRGPLETSFAKYLTVNYQQIDTVEVQEVTKELRTLVLHIHNDYVEIPELFEHLARPLHEFVMQRSIENLKKEQVSGRFNPDDELKKLETLLSAGAITKKEYQTRKARIERLLALSGVHSKAAFQEILARGGRRGE